MDNITKVSVSTKTSADDKVSVNTALTIDWSDCTPEDIRAMAQQALVVKLQGAWRRKGIPEGETNVRAADHKVGVRGPKETPMEAIARLAKDPAMKAKLLEMLAG